MPAVRLKMSAQCDHAARADSLPIYLADPGGFVALHYPPGFDPAGVKKDLGKLIK